MRATLALFAISLAPVAVSAQRAGVTQLPDSVVAAIDRHFAWTGPETPGCAIGVAKDGIPVLTRAYGMANLEFGVPARPETVL